MNKHVQRVEAQLLVSITELKKNPSSAIAAAQHAPVAVLNHNKVAAYLLRPEVYEYLLECHEDLEDIGKAAERRNDPSIRADVDELDTL
jgi:antitoxin StbD